jgi:fatty acid desaturase
VRLHAFNRIDLLPELGELGTSFSRRSGVGIVVLLFVLFIVVITVAVVVLLLVLFITVITVVVVILLLVLFFTVITLVPASSFRLTLGENRSAPSVKRLGM